MRSHRVVMILLLALTGCGTDHGVHESQLALEHHDGYVVPSFARDSGGQPYSGRAHGTFFGQTSMDCIEWEGTFSSGRPDGSFLVYSDCSSTPGRMQFKNGIRAEVPGKSFKPAPHRGAA